MPPCNITGGGRWLRSCPPRQPPGPGMGSLTLGVWAWVASPVLPCVARMRNYVTEDGEDRARELGKGRTAARPRLRNPWKGYGAL